jgi:hypothetical protein
MQGDRMGPATEKMQSEPTIEDLPGHEANGIRPMLRIGVMLDSFHVPAWVASLLTEIERSGVARIELVVLNAEPRQSSFQRLLAARQRFLWLLYDRIDRWIVRRLLKIRQDAFDSVDVAPLLAGRTTLTVTPLCKGFSQRFDESSTAAVKAADLDVLLRFGFRILRGDVLKTARYGVWSYHHGDNREYRGGPAMFWEMFEGNYTVGVTLQILTDVLDGGQVIYRSLGKTNFFSLYLNRNRSYWKGAAFVPRRLRELASGGGEVIATWNPDPVPMPYSRGIYRVPRNWVMLVFLARLAVRGVKRFFQNMLTKEEWFFAWRRRQPNELPGTTLQENRVTVQWPPADRFFADPFLIKHDGRNCIFFEDFGRKSGKAGISFVELDAAGRASPAKPALSPDYHLSYPFVFAHEGQVYMIPESRAMHRVELWRAEVFPDRWVRQCTLIEGLDAVDATWLAHDGKFWLFANVGIAGDSGSDELHVFWSDEPFGPWQPLPGNPVVSTVRGARPAGRIFEHQGSLVRPGQDSAKIYGHRVILYRIEELNIRRYREQAIGTIEPDWLPGNIGTHSLDVNDDFEVVDGRVRVSKISWLNPTVRS